MCGDGPRRVQTPSGHHLAPTTTRTCPLSPASLSHSFPYCHAPASMSKDPKRKLWFWVAYGNEGSRHLDSTNGLGTTWKPGCCWFNLTLAIPSFRVRLSWDARSRIRVTSNNLGDISSFLVSHLKPSSLTLLGALHLPTPFTGLLPERPVWQLCLAHTVPGSFTGLAPGPRLCNQSVQSDNQASLGGDSHQVKGHPPKHPGDEFWQFLYPELNLCSQQQKVRFMTSSRDEGKETRPRDKGKSTGAG